MQAVAHSFTLGSSLGQTGFTSEPVKGKKTGDMLTAGEYNRILELVGEGGSGAGWENVPLTDIADFDPSCLYRYDVNYVVDDQNRKWMNANSAKIYTEAVSNKFIRRELDTTTSLAW